MSSIALAAKDSNTMLRRQMVHILRYPELMIYVIGLPVVFLLLFVFVFGGTLGAGLAPGADLTGGEGRSTYANYVVPGIMMMGLSVVATTISTKVSMDMTQGIIARFKSLPIAPGAVLTGHAVAGAVQGVAASLLVLLVGILVGFRPGGGPLGWAGAVGILTMLSLGLAWVSVGCGLAARSVETASNLLMPLTFLPFLGSGFVPTDSMPTAIRWFADYQPFTPVMDSVRSLLAGTPVDPLSVWLAVGWSLVLLVGGWVWSRRLYARPAR